MTSRDFAYWLQGFFEVSKVETLNPEQTELVKRHLELVFKHEIDPSMGSVEHQAELRRVHEGQPAEEPAPKVVHHHHHDDSERRIMC